MSLISRLRAVVAGDDYLDGELDDFAYDDEQQDQDQRAMQADGGALATLGDSNPFPELEKRLRQVGCASDDEAAVL